MADSPQEATTKDWAWACSLAHARLCQGTHGARVRPREAWLEAIGRVAGELLQEHNYWRRGKPADAWVDVLRGIADQRSTAPDRLVQVGALRVPLGSFPRYSSA